MTGQKQFSPRPRACGEREELLWGESRHHSINFLHSHCLPLSRCLRLHCSGGVPCGHLSLPPVAALCSDRPPCSERPMCTNERPFCDQRLPGVTTGWQSSSPQERP